MDVQHLPRSKSSTEYCLSVFSEMAIFEAVWENLQKNVEYAVYERMGGRV